MAALLTVDRIEYVFDPAGIVAISDRDPSSDKPATCVFGISTNYLVITESVPDFMARLDVVRKFGRLTRTDGVSIWINKSSVLSIRGRVRTDIADANAVITISALTPVTEWVSETIDAAAAALGIPAV